ncbi:predicted protein [Paenibacillus sp. JCM 10914]|nr:predicted protein [Paenibacillus sp. JCM 10914]
MKLVLLIAVIAAINITLFSPGLLGLDIQGGDALQTAFGVTVLVVSGLVLLYGSYVLLFKAPVTKPVRKITTREDYIEALHDYRHHKALKKDIALALDQLDRIEKKKHTLFGVLSQRFEENELSYKKFHGVIMEVEKLFYLNIRGILNKLSVFDASDFSRMGAPHGSQPFSNRLVQERSDLYTEYLSFVTGYLGVNEEILLKLDKLLLEISLLGSTDYRDVDEMPCMQEIDALIKQTKLYKQ